MATSKTLTPTNVTIQIPAMTDAPDQSVNSNCIDKLGDAVNTLNSQLFLMGSTQAISSATDFNTLLDIKNYSISTNSVAASSANCPSNSAGKLCTWTVDGGSFDRTWAYGGQIYVDIPGNVFMRQISTNGSKTLSFGTWQNINGRTQLTITRTENSYASATEVARCTAHRCGKTLMFIFNCSLSGANMTDFVEIGSISGWSASNDVFQTVMPQSGESKPVIVQITAAGKIKIYGAQGTAYSFYRCTLTAPEY